jgi:hypothetical protein
MAAQPHSGRAAGGCWKPYAQRASVTLREPVVSGGSTHSHKSVSAAAVTSSVPLKLLDSKSVLPAACQTGPGMVKDAPRYPPATDLAQGEISRRSFASISRTAQSTA